jgi:chromate transporter
MPVSLAEATKLWFKIGCLSFGGPAAQIALLHRELVDEKKWLDERDFLSALNFCMLLPGPEAMQLATYAGWKLHKTKGGLIAGLLFVLPGAAVVLALSIIYSYFGKLPLLEAIFWGIKCAVVIIVLEALLRVSKKALKTSLDWAVAAAAFTGLFVFAIPFPIIILAAGVFGFIMQKQTKPSQGQALPPHFETLKTIATWLAIWFLPLMALHVLLGPNNLLVQLAIFFSKLSVVTFGGAYAVLSYMGQHVVETTHWLTTAQMMDGLALAETTPGPLILVGQFVGFTAAQNGGLWQAIAASLIFLWATFVPCFLWIFAGAPYIEYLKASPRLSSALSRITAAVAGVILNLSLWFALHVFFQSLQRKPGLVPIWWPVFGTIDFAAIGLTLVLLPLSIWWKAAIPKTLFISATAGFIIKYILAINL